MKRILGILVVLALCIVSVSAMAEGATISAIGSGTVTLVPDMATFSVGITTQNALVSRAQSINAATMQTIVDTLLENGVAREDIQTSQYSVYPVYDYQGSYSVVTGYEVSNTVTVVVRKLDQMPALLDASVQAGANNVYSLGFQSSKQAAAYDEAMQAAAQDALRKASLMAQAIGKEAGAVQSLTESGYTTALYTENRSYAMMDSAAGTPIENGQITVTAEVVAVIEIK